MLYRMKSGCDKSSYTGTKNYSQALLLYWVLCVHYCSSSFLIAEIKSFCLHQELLHTVVLRS